MANEAEVTVRALLRSRESLSEEALAEILGCFTEDAVWHNMPVEPAVGKAAIAAVLRHAVPVSEGLDIEIKNVATQGTTVFVEHVDTHLGAGKKIVIPCCGVFETRDGLISVWRDYFDMRTWKKQGGA
jgi:limonene-1,2-epoxide hydrolase